jgi:hypothetical protein
VAAQQQGRFDQVLEPPIDPDSGELDLPGELEWKETNVRALAAAKAMSNMPGYLLRHVSQGCAVRRVGLAGLPYSAASARPYGVDPSRRTKGLSCSPRLSPSAIVRRASLCSEGP